MEELSVVSCERVLNRATSVEETEAHDCPSDDKQFVDRIKRIKKIVEFLLNADLYKMNRASGSSFVMGTKVGYRQMHNQFTQSLGEPGTDAHSESDEFPLPEEKEEKYEHSLNDKPLLDEVKSIERIVEFLLDAELFKMNRASGGSFVMGTKVGYGQIHSNFMQSMEESGNSAQSGPISDLFPDDLPAEVSCCVIQ